MKRIAILFFFLLSMFVDARGEVFTVTSNLNDGPGTLREAIALANANGTAEKDFIYFILAGINPADVTITLTAELPVLSSNLTIDGSTQPGNALSGLDGIRIALVNGSVNRFNGLSIIGATMIEIYGIYFSNFTASPAADISERKAGIFLKDVSDIRIGAADKRNGFGGNYAGILAPSVFPASFTISSVQISSNLIGLSADGASVAANEVGIDLSYLSNSTIGGSEVKDGNIIAGNKSAGIACGVMRGNVRIIHNVIGMTYGLKRAAVSPQADGIYANGVNSSLQVISNVVVGQKRGVALESVNQGFALLGNYIGTDRSGAKAFGNEYGIEVYNCNYGSIGGLPLSYNTVAFNKTGILIRRSYPITITANSIYCNEQEAIAFDEIPPNKEITQSTIGQITNNSASGVYLADATIELFYDDDCPDCQGKTLFAIIETQADGSWSYTHPAPFSGGITSTGTNSDGATSAFSKPKLDDERIEITGTFCGTSDGSIKGVSVSDASTYKWYNAADVEVGDQKDLKQVPAGQYYLVAGQPGACSVRSPLYNIANADLNYKAKEVTVTPANCNESNGSIAISSYETAIPTVFEWRNESGEIIATTPGINNLAPGVYRLTASNGKGCVNEVAEFRVGVAAMPALNLTGVIRSANCDGRFVSLTGLTVEGETGPYTYSWVDKDNEEVSSSLELKGVVRGKYSLKYTDRYGCTQTEQFDLTSIQGAELVIPNSFSPNGDGKNDRWAIEGAVNYPDAEVSVYNRYGAVVFQSKGYATEFDGNYKNNALPAGVYYYVIDLKSGCPRLTGSLTIIK